MTISATELAGGRKPLAYREPWFWMVMAPLIIVIILGFGFLYVAFVGADDRVEDDYYKEGRMINNRFAAQTHALALHLLGDARFDFSAREVQVNLTGDQLPSQISLQLSHPAKMQKDVTLNLVRVGDSLYRGSLSQDFTGHWYLLLSAGAGDDQWRITALADFDQSKSISFIPHL